MEEAHAIAKATKKRRHRIQRVDERVQNLQTELQLHAKTNAATDVTLTFNEELALQAELTTLDEFQYLARKLVPLANTTPQLLHHLPKVVALLQAELEMDATSDVRRERLTPVLKLLTALVRELRNQFYPHFAGILPHVIAVIDSSNVRFCLI